MFTMDKKGLLTIKEFSEITQVNPKSLRYYDSIGILKPVYVDPGNGYRYYSLYQREIVYAIGQLVELGIPIKELASYCNPNDTRIKFNDLNNLAINTMEEKILQYQISIAYRKYLSTLIEHSEVLRCSSTPLTCEMDAIDCIAIPFSSKQHSDLWLREMQNLILLINRNELSLGGYTGILQIKESEEWKQYLFVSLDRSSTTPIDGTRYIHIPKGTYLCKKTEESGIEHVWDWSKDYVESDEIELIYEIELLEADYHFFPPALEQRCLLKND